MLRPDGEIVPGDATPRRNGECGATICLASMAPDFDVLCLGYRPRIGIMDQITQLDDSIERLARISDELEQQVAPCPPSRLRLIT